MARSFARFKSPAVENTPAPNSRRISFSTSGRFRSVGEVVEEGLRLVEDREARNAQKLATLREAIRVADESVAAGDYLEFDSPEALEQYLRELTERVLGTPAK